MFVELRIAGCFLLVTAALLGPGLAAAPSPSPGDQALERLLQQELYAAAMDHSVAALRLRAARSGALDPGTLDALEKAGRTACEAGEYAIGESLLLAALDAYRGTMSADDPRLSTPLIALGRVARIKGLRDLAWRRYEEARRLLERAGPEWETVRVELEQGEGNWHRKEDTDKALNLYHQSLARQRRLAPEGSFDEAEKLTWTGWMLGRIGRTTEAGEYLNEARTMLHKLDLKGHSLHAVIDNALAERLSREGRWDEAAPYFANAARIFAASRQGFPPGFARRVRPLDGHDALTVIALRRGRWEEAWTTLQQSRSAVYMDFARLGLWATKDPEGFSDARALRADLLKQRRALAGRDGRISWSQTTWKSVVEFLENRGHLRDLQTRYLDRFPAPVLSLQRTQAMLGPRSALLGIVEMDFGIDAVDAEYIPRKEAWLYVLRRSGPIVWIPLSQPDPEDEMRLGHAWARTWRAAFWPLHVDPDPEVEKDLRALGRRYLDPALPHLAGIEHLVVEGAMVPFEVLRGKDGRHAGDTFDITYIPSAGIAVLLAERWAGDTPREMRSILSVSAAPSGSSPPLEKLALVPKEQRDLRRPRMSYIRSETPLDMLPPLPFAASEAELVAGKFPQSTLLQADVERRLRVLEGEGNLASFDVVHFAGHSLSDGTPELAGLALAHEEPDTSGVHDGILDVEEILLGWNLEARLLTLSGCETARAAGAERGELLGFTPALLEVGARSIVSSLWPVDDRATAILMDRFYDNLTGRYEDLRLGKRSVPMPVARALREAKLHLRDMTDRHGRRSFDHPVYWAGFILMGLPEPL